MREFKIAAIGLDTSHTVEFAKLLQGPDTPDDLRIKGLKIVNAMRFPSAFQPEEGQDKRQQQLEALGVKMQPNIEKAAAGMDGILLELNDPGMHLEYFEKILQYKLPVFLDKPLADNYANGKKIFDLAQSNNIRVWSGSSLRFMAELAEAKLEVGAADLCYVFGALGKAARGSDVIWYGIHGAEMLNEIMGNGARSVFARADERGVVAVIQYGEGRRGVLELNRGGGYGGRIQRGKTMRQFMLGHEGKPIYWHLLVRIAAFFLDGVQPVDIESMLEVQQILDAIEKSLADGAEITLVRD